MIKSIFSQESKNVSHFQVGSPIPLILPFQLNTTNLQGFPCDRERLLETHLSLPTNFDSFSKRETDATHPLLFPVPKEGYVFQWVRFRLNVERFSRIRFAISCSAPFEGYINGEKRAFDLSIKGEVSSSSVGYISLDCVPRTYEFLFKILLSDGEEKEINFSVSYQMEKGHSMYVKENFSNVRMLHISNYISSNKIKGCVLSSHGTYALIERDAPNENNAPTRSIWEIVRVRDGELLFEIQGGKEQMGWMPQGERIYYTCKIGKRRELHIWEPIGNGKDVCLSSALPEGKFHWSEDENYLYYTIGEKAEEEKGDLRQYLSPEDRQPTYRNRTRLARYDLKNGLLQPLTFGVENSVFDDVKGKEFLLFRTCKCDATHWPFYFASLYRMNLRTLKVDIIGKDEANIQYDEARSHSFCFLENEEKCALIASPMAFGGMGKMIGEREMPNIYECDLYFLDLRTHKVECMSKDFSPSIVSMVSCQWDKNRLFLLCDDRDYRSIYCYHITEKYFEKFPLEVEVVKGFSLASQAPTLLYWGESLSKPTEVWTYHIKEKKSFPLSFPSQEMFKGAELAEVKEWNFQNSAGDTIEGRYYLPPHFNPMEKYPLIVYYYGGTIATERTFEGRYPLHLYATQGYVVYVPEPSGAIGWGQKFSAHHVKGWGGRAVEDIIEGVETFCKEHTFVDKGRIGCIGASYGGFTTEAILTKTSPFRAAISHAGISSLASYWGEGYWGYSYSGAATAHCYPWTDPQFYTERSPLFSADKIHTPLLLLHGGEDTNVPIGESIQLFTALKLLGREVEFIEIKGENHHILTPSKCEEWQNTIFAWFAKHLQDSPEWWEALYPKQN